MEYFHERLQLIINNSSEPDTHKKIAKVLIENLCNIDTYTIESIAEISFTSVSTVSRFIKSLGFNSFTEFRARFKSYNISRMLQINDIRNGINIKDKEAINDYIDTLTINFNSLKNNIDFNKIDKINNIIYNSKNIAISGSLLSASIALFYQIYMLYFGKYVSFYNFFSNENTIEDDIDVFIIFSVEGNFVSAQKEKILNLKLRNKKIILITQNPRIIISHIFDEILYIGEHHDHKFCSIIMRYIYFIEF